MRPRYAVVGVALIIATAGVVALASLAADTPVTRVYACVNRANHAQRTGAVATTTCPAGYALVSWPVVEAPTTTTTTRPATTTAAALGVIRPSTTGSFTFRNLKVWYSSPANLAAARVLVVMHGQSRGGQSYRDQWSTTARQAGALLIVPEFSTSAYPGDAYTLGPTSFAQIEPLYDHVKADTGNTSTSYLFYGHSAGAQFVHRLLLLQPNRVSRAVAANAGWYTAAEDVLYPYGLRNAPPHDAPRWLASSMTVLLGEKDTDPNASDLRQTPEADRQGLHRFARGQFFYRTGVDYAAVRSLPFGWTLRTIPGAEHANADMMPTAAQVLFG